MDFVDQIAAAFERTGKSKQGLARLLKRHNNVVTYILDRKRDIKASEVPIIRKYLEMDPVVPVRGHVGATSEEVFYEHGDDPGETVPAPANATDETVAVEIRGDSLGAGLNGWLAFYDDLREPITADLLGRLCVVGLPEGKILIKIPRQARQKGRYHLFPNGPGEMIPDAQIKWAARVTLLAPKPPGKA